MNKRGLKFPLTQLLICFVRPRNKLNYAVSLYRDHVLIRFLAFNMKQLCILFSDTG